MKTVCNEGGYFCFFSQVNIPKQRKSFCPPCKRHTTFKVTQYKAGKASLYAQGNITVMFQMIKINAEPHILILN